MNIGIDKLPSIRLNYQQDLVPLAMSFGQRGLTFKLEGMASGGLGISQISSGLNIDSFDDRSGTVGFEAFSLGTRSIMNSESRWNPNPS